MQSSSSGPSDHFGDNKPDNPVAVPDFARAWGSSAHQKSTVRRPSTPLDPQSYHEVIEPEAIFELDEKQEDGSIKTIFVVPFGCKQCRSFKQACSRARPTCARCRKSGRSCEVLQRGYQRLPGPKVEKPSTRIQSGTGGTCKKSTASLSAQDLAGTSRSRARRTSSRVPSLSQAPPSDSGPSVAPGSKRPLSPASATIPRRKKATLQKREALSFTVTPPTEVNDEFPEAVGAQVVSAGEHSALKWTFAKRQEKSSAEPERVHSIPCNTLIPRVWTNSLGSLLTVFPELGKSKMGFSWFQSETPILLLGTNYARGHWINTTTLQIDLLWDFSCRDSELEPIIGLDTEGSAAYSPENALDCEAETMGLRDSYLPPGTGLFPTQTTVSSPLPAFSTQTLPSDGTPPGERATHESYTGMTRPIHRATQSDSASAAQLYSSNPLSLPRSLPPPHPYPVAPSGSLAHHATPQPSFKLRIPLTKPAEVETFLDSHLRSIPLLLWLSHDSALVPRSLPPEYAYLCMGLFFISDLGRAVVQHDVSSTTGLVQGRVCWSVTLQWAPGGEDALFDCNSVPPSSPPSDSAPVDTTRDLLHPWWLDPTHTLSQPDHTTLPRPRDLRMQFFSFIPLDLLAEFHPSESFPRGWFCKSCGMINIQMYFRHQICQSTSCKFPPDKHVPPGKVDPLSSLRDPYQSSTLIRPTNKIPSVVVSDNITWDDGMQSWIYGVKDGVVLCHIFTGNQEGLQSEATALLERIQCEVLLRKENAAGPYFTYSTKLSHSNDGSEAMVPGGTPSCVRVAYYMLCDFVHRYGEMVKPRFGEIRMQAWVNPGSKRGNVLYASKSSVVVHCLGARVVLNFTPKGGYEDAASSTTLDKGKGCAKVGDRAGSPPTAPCAGPSRHLGQDNDNQEQLTAGSEANESPIVTENVVEATAAMDTVRQYHGHDTDGIAIPSPNTSPGMEVTQHEDAERGVRKKDKATKPKVKASVPEISMTLVHGDCVVLSGDDFECQVVRTGTTILVIGFPEET